MKKYIALFGLLASLSVYGADEVHEFTLSGEPAFSAAVISCSSLSDTVELLSPDGHIYTLAFSKFDIDDQDYLKQWEMAELFMSPTQFVIVPTRCVDQKWFGEEKKGLDGKGVSRVSGVSEYQYHLTLYNLGETSLENITLNCHVLYTQYDAASDASPFVERASFDAAEEAMVSLSQTVDATIPVARLDAGAWKIYETTPVVLSDEEAARSSSHIVINVSLEMENGDILSRQIELPDHHAGQSLNHGV